MAGRIQEIGKLCRFCLCQESLMVLATAMNSAFTIEDMIRHTDIQISEQDKHIYAICYKCCKEMKNTVTFRRSCLSNNKLFKQLLAVLAESVTTCSNGGDGASCAIGSPIAIDSDSEQSIEEQSLSDESESETTDIPIAANSASNHGVEEGSEIDEEMDALSEAEIVSLSDNDSDYSVPSLYGEVMEKAAIDRLLAASSAQQVECSTENNIQIVSAAKVDRKGPKYEEKQLCPYCGIMSNFLIHHIKNIHLRIRRFECPQCPKKYPDNSTLKEHINSVHEKRIILTCDKCGKGFTNSNSHYYHMVNSHGKSDIYECETCHRKFKSYDGYRKHLKEHSLTAYPCPDCDKLFKTSLTLEKHQLRYHST